MAKKLVPELPAWAALAFAAVAWVALGAGGAALWWRTRAVLQHLAVFASAAILVGTAVCRLGPGIEEWGPGLAVWALSVLWAWR